MEKCNVIFVLGAPGSGKSTLCSQLATYLDYQHLSAGELIRQEARTPGSEYGAQVAAAIKVPGAFVPAEITVALLRRAMSMAGKREFLIDAFPVNEANLAAWETKMASEAEIPCVLFLDVPMRVATQRCLGRQRGDDTQLVLEKRWEAYMGQTRPIVEIYEKKGLLRTVDASKTPEEVLEATKRVLPVKGKDTEPDRSKSGL